MSFDAAELVVDPGLIRRYDGAGPRYTSYPTADRFAESYGAPQHLSQLEALKTWPHSKPLSLYFHLPFCSNICFYCACNKVITKDHGRSAKYVRYLRREMALVSGVIGTEHRVDQLHWGGGTPTFLSQAEMTDLMMATREFFSLSDGGEFSLEVDPRGMQLVTFETLGKLGFNRISIGVQDFDSDVQAAIHRLQTEEETRFAVEAARANGISSVSVDLIYGLPKQSVDGFARTLDKVIALSPDRLALYSYAHMPAVFKPQRRILPADMPPAEIKLQLLTLAIHKLTQAGYVYIGMDHFAKPDDELNIARLQSRLHRNFQGYSTRRECDLIALGISAISKVGNAYAQNVKTLDDYYGRLDRNELPTQRGVALTHDDEVRRAVIQTLMCQFKLNVESIQNEYDLDFWTYFADVADRLREMQANGLVTVDANTIVVTPRGRLLVRALAMIFDRYLPPAETRQRFSNVI